MAVGRQDYQAGVVPVKSGYSLTQTPFFENEVKAVQPAGNGVFCEYTVGAGYELHVCGYRISSNKPFQQIYAIVLDAHVELQCHFDMNIIDNFPDNSPMIIEAGETVSIVLYNSDEVAHTYSATLFGYLEQIES